MRQAATDEAIDAPDTEPAQLHLWIVELEADGGRCCHTWTGYATNSIEASYNAKLEFLDRSIQSEEAWQARGLRARSIAQVGI